MKSVLPPLSFWKDKGGKTLFTGYFWKDKGGKTRFTGYFWKDKGGKTLFLFTYGYSQDPTYVIRNWQSLPKTKQITALYYNVYLNAVILISS